jgi:hypothetical protein
MISLPALACAATAATALLALACAATTATALLALACAATAATALLALACDATTAGKLKLARKHACRYCTELKNAATAELKHEAKGSN